MRLPALAYFAFVFAPATLRAEAIDPATLAAFRTVPPAAQVEFEHLARCQISSDEIARMRSVPGLAPALMELADRLIAEGEDSEHLYFVFEALYSRGDLKEEQQASLRALILPLFGKDAGSVGDVIKSWALNILAEYPGVENEDVLIKFLGDRKGQDNAFGYSFVSAENLGRMGTSRSLQPLRDYAARIKPPPGVRLTHYETAMDAVQQVVQRMQGRSHSSLPPTNSSQSREVGAGKRGPEVMGDSVPAAGSRVFKGVVGVTLAAALALLALLLRTKWMR